MLQVPVFFPPGHIVVGIEIGGYLPVSGAERQSHKVPADSLFGIEKLLQHVVLIFWVKSVKRIQVGISPDAAHSKHGLEGSGRVNDNGIPLVAVRIYPLHCDRLPFDQEAILFCIRNG